MLTNLFRFQQTLLLMMAIFYSQMAMAQSPCLLSSNFHPVTTAHNNSTPFISVLSPGNGTVWQVGQTVAVTWLDNISNNVNITIYQGTTPIYAVGTNTPSDGYHSFVVPNVNAATNYHIRISPVGHVAGLSDGLSGAVEIQPDPNAGPNIDVFSPGTGAVLYTGRSVAVRWTDNISENVNITIYRGVTPVYGLTASTASDGYYRFTVPNLAPNNAYYIRVSSVNNIQVFGNSGAFEIRVDPNATPVIDIVSPTSSSSWRVGQNVGIHWTDNISEPVSIVLYKSNVQVRTIASSTPSDGYHLYTVPNLVAGSDYTIKITSTNNGAVQATSEAFDVFHNFGNNGSRRTAVVAIEGEESTTPASLSEIGILPNPQKSGQNLRLQLNVSASTTAQVSIQDLTGRRVHEQQLRLNEGEQQLDLPVLLPAGTYVVSVQTDETIKSTQFLVVD